MEHSTDLPPPHPPTRPFVESEALRATTVQPADLQDPTLMDMSADKTYRLGDALADKTTTVEQSTRHPPAPDMGSWVRLSARPG